MDEKSLRKRLADLPLGEIRYLHQTGSTNDVALVWATEGAPDLSVVVADEQTSGRGRMGRRWLTPPESALAISVILHPTLVERNHLSLLSGLGALSLTQLLTDHGLPAQIKWPNDIVISGRKTAGILVELVWMGDQVESAVLGIGVNVLPESVPSDTEVQFPATSIHTAGWLYDRLDILHDLLANLIGFRSQLGEPIFIQSWESALAYMNEPVHVWAEPSNGISTESTTGIIRGLDPDGALKLETSEGIRLIKFGEIHLRPAKSGL
jgi:BirA family biotin operon repressor/biotin-[acetyl-CoA-carboxylase] ligase